MMSLTRLDKYTGWASSEGPRVLTVCIWGELYPNNYFSRNKKKISILFLHEKICSGTQENYVIVVDNRFPNKYFSYFSVKISVVVFIWNWLSQATPMRTHNNVFIEK